MKNLIHRKNIHKSEVIGLILGLLLLAACGGSSKNKEMGGQSSGSGNLTNLLFSDDFSNTSSGWDRISTMDGMTNYEDDQYHIQINRPDYDVFANPYRSFNDVRVEVEATDVGGIADNNFGIICRCANKDDYYAGLVTSDGHYGIFKFKGGVSILLGVETMPTSPVILPAQEMNLIRLDCIGSTLTLYVNGIQLDSRQDAEFKSGDVGLLAGSYKNAGVEITFDNFKVYSP
jgi:hypothetical protein